MTQQQGKPSMVLKLRMCARLAALACGAFLLAGAPAQAQTGVLDSMLGLLGLKSDEQPDIEYRERAPLVVPPQMKLRTPEAPASARNAAWPNDPDVARRAAEEKYRKTPVGERADRKYLDGELRRPSDIPGGRTYGKTTPSEPAPFVVEGSLAESGWVAPDKLKAMAPKAQEQNLLVAGQEPPRRYLTDPPTGMRVPSNKAPLNAGKTLVAPRLSDREEKDPLNTYRPKPKSPDDE